MRKKTNTQSETNNTPKLPIKLHTDYDKVQTTLENCQAAAEYLQAFKKPFEQLGVGRFDTWALRDIINGGELTRTQYVEQVQNECNSIKTLSIRQAAMNDAKEFNNEFSRMVNGMRYKSYYTKCADMVQYLQVVGGNVTLTDTAVNDIEEENTKYIHTEKGYNLYRQHADIVGRLNAFFLGNVPQLYGGTRALFPLHIINGKQVYELGKCDYDNFAVQLERLKDHEHTPQYGA